MADTPQVKPGEWIKVGNQDCVVTETTGNDDADGQQCEVVFDPDDPRHDKVVWNGKEWLFPEIGKGGYAEEQPRLVMYVKKLKGGLPG